MPNDFHAPSREDRRYGPASGLSGYPATAAEWDDRYARLESWYVGDAYTTAEITAFHLFRVLDDTGKEIAYSKRLFDGFKYIVDRNVEGFLSGGLTLEVADGIEEGPRASLLVAGEAVWNRSHVDEQIERWITTGAKFGAFGLEVVRRTSDARAVLMLADPRNTRVWYDDETGTELVKVTTTTRYRDADVMNPRDGVVEAGAQHEYRREIDATQVRVFIDGKLSADESGPHFLGRVPFVWMVWKPCGDPEHGLSAAHGCEGALMRADSLIEEVGAIANRHGYPWVVAKGFQVGSASDVSNFGRILSGVPADGALEMVTGGGEAIPGLLEAIGACMAEVRQAPEFVFTEGGAGESGEARSYKASAFEAKVKLARDRILTGIARAVWYGTMMDGRRAITPGMEDVTVFKIDAGPILPRNLKSEVEMLMATKTSVKAADHIRGLQRIGIVDQDEDPEAYAAEVADETATRATQFFDAAGGDPNANPLGGSGAAE